MKPLPMLCASVGAILAFALSADGALAGSTINNSKSNNLRAADPGAGGSVGMQAPPTAEADCTKQGGTVVTGQDGTKGCVIASTKKTICLVYKPGHEGDDRYCSQSVPAP